MVRGNKWGSARITDSLRLLLVTGMPLGGQQVGNRGNGGGVGGEGVVVSHSYCKYHGAPGHFPSLCTQPWSQGNSGFLSYEASSSGFWLSWELIIYLLQVHSHLVCRALILTQRHKIKHTREHSEESSRRAQDGSWENHCQRDTVDCCLVLNFKLFGCQRMVNTL